MPEAREAACGATLCGAAAEPPRELRVHRIRALELNPVATVGEQAVFPVWPSVDKAFFRDFRCCGDVVLAPHQEHGPRIRRQHFARADVSRRSLVTETR